MTPLENKTSRTRSSSENGAGRAVSLHKGDCFEQDGEYFLVYRPRLGTLLVYDVLIKPWNPVTGYVMAILHFLMLHYYRIKISLRILFYFI